MEIIVNDAPLTGFVHCEHTAYAFIDSNRMTNSMCHTSNG